MHKLLLWYIVIARKSCLENLKGMQIDFLEWSNEKMGSTKEIHYIFDFLSFNKFNNGKQSKKSDKKGWVQVQDYV